MKKNKKLTFLMIVIILASLIFCVKSIKGSEKQTLTVTDPDGITYLAVLDQNNNVYAGITDTAGNLYGARIAEDGYPVLDDSLYAVGAYDGTLPRNNTTAVNIQQSNAGETYNYNADVSVIEEDSTSSTTSANSDSGANNTATGNAENSSDAQNTQTTAQTEYLSDKYKTLFSSGTYQMTFTSDDPDLPNEITMALRDGSVYLETTVEGMPAQVIYDNTQKKGAIVIKTLRIYCTLPDDMVEEFASGTLNLDFDEPYNDIKSYKVNINDRECICESYEYESGEINNFYFYNNELVRLDVISADGSSSVYNITAISSDVPDSYFEMPKGYIKLDISKLLEDEGTGE